MDWVWNLLSNTEVFQDGPFIFKTLLWALALFMVTHGTEWPSVSLLADNPTLFLSQDLLDEAPGKEMKPWPQRYRLQYMLKLYQYLVDLDGHSGETHTIRVMMIRLLKLSAKRSLVYMDPELSSGTKLSTIPTNQSTVAYYIQLPESATERQ